MKNELSIISLLILLIIPSCAPNKNIQPQTRSDRIVQKINSDMNDIKKELSPAMAILSINDKKIQKQKLKKVIFRLMQKRYKKSSWFRINWLRLSSGLNDYRDVPFHAFESILDSKIKLLNKEKKQLDSVKTSSADNLKDDIQSVTTQLEQLKKLTIKHDRYTQEDDKICLAKKIAASRAVIYNQYY